MRTYAWESHHSLENQLEQVTLLSKEIAQELNLSVQIPDMRMAESRSGRPAALPIVSGDSHHNHESLLLVRQDLLDRFLERKQLRLLLFVWGERQPNHHNEDSDDARRVGRDFELQEILHRQGFLYGNGDFSRVL